MSYDFDVKQAACDHAQTLERYVIDSSDFRTLRLAAYTSIAMRAPINGKTSVKLYINGSLATPDHAIYGYQLVLDQARTQAEDGTLFYKIMFNHQVRLIVPLIEVSYMTIQNYCLKCNGLGQVNDLKKSISGSLIHTIQTDKLVQKSLKFILTSTCPFYPQYTCPIKNYIGKKFGVQITDADIGNAIAQALTQMKNIQSVQRNVQALDPFEMLKDITDVTSVTDSTDPTKVNVSVRVSSYGSPTSQTLGFSLTTTKSTQYYSPGGAS